MERPGVDTMNGRNTQVMSAEEFRSKMAKFNSNFTALPSEPVAIRINQASLNPDTAKTIIRFIKQHRFD